MTNIPALTSSLPSINQWKYSEKKLDVYYTNEGYAFLSWWDNVKREEKYINTAKI